MASKAPPFGSERESCVSEAFKNWVTDGHHSFPDTFGDGNFAEETLIIMLLI